MPKLTNAKMKYFLKDEKKANKEYTKYGLKSLAADEKRHANFFKKKLNKTKKR